MSDSGHDQWGPGTGSSADYGYGEPTAPRYSSSPFTSAPHSTSPFGDAPQAAPGAAGAAGAAAPSSATPPPYGAVTAPYGAAPVPHDPYAGGYPDPRYVRRTNGLATVSLILSLAGLVTYGMTSVVGVILGHIARSQIKHSGEAGAGLALGGLISGYCIIGLMGVLMVVSVLISFATGSS
ncbi:MAG TPA: DUF4190 domain-containing protein [Brevibacterium senegalense]|uniref:DUF4190 domain-containing protein n=1 Tax=Brevibacterium senegalense TaxID=1033736 RepID=A0A921MCE0_9MICO|nr:DUF4190 domain-containing protein [Brevibacterium senegalense]